MLCPGCRRVLGGEQEFVKTFTSWQLVASWWVLDGLPCGAGGYVFGRITPLAPAWTMPLFSAENNGALLDGAPSICYNVYNGRREKLYNVTESHQTGKNAPIRRFAPPPYKFPLCRQKRRTAHLHRNW